MRAFLFLLIIVFLVSLVFLYRNYHRTSNASFSFVAAGDWGSQPDTTIALKKISRLNPNFAIALGDLSYDYSRPEKIWCDYIKSHLGQNFPFLLVAGNHEDENLDDGIGGFIDNFIDCLPVKRDAIFGSYGKRYYFDYKKLARFILIARSATLGGEVHNYNAGDRRYEWVAHTIDSAREKGIPWIIVGVTDVCLSMGLQECEGSDLSNLLVSRKVDLVLQAHDHTYQRSKQLALSKHCPYISSGQFNPNCIVEEGGSGVYEKGKGTVFVVNGAVGGGAGLTPINMNDPDAGYFTAWMGLNFKPKKGFSIYSVNKKRLQGSFVSTTDTSEFSDDFFINDDPKFKNDIIPDTERPQVKITSQVDYQVLRYGSQYNIVASAHDNIGINRVEFLANTISICTDDTEPYTCAWTVLGNHRGQSFSLVAKAFDASGNISYSFVPVWTK